MQTKHLTKAFAGAVALSMLLMAGTNAFAGQPQENAGNASKSFGIEGRGHKGDFRGPGKGFMKGEKGLDSILPELVKDGTLTKAESDKVSSFVKEKQDMRKAEKDKVKSMTAEERKAYMEANRGKHQDMFSELVSKGILTQSKADAVRKRVELKHQHQEQARLQEMTDRINKLAESGTITKDQAFKVIEGIKKNREEKKALGEKLKTMNPEERKAFIKANRNQMINPLKKLVDDKTLTQDQASAIKSAIRPEHKK